MSMREIFSFVAMLLANAADRRFLRAFLTNCA
jgi:hypothetical protein